MSKAAELAALIGSQSALSNRNLIINGAMQVSQRATSVTGVTGDGYQAVDRWRTNSGSLGTFTLSQSTDAPDGFATSHKYDCTTADASPAAGDFLIFEQRVEAQNLQQLNYGTSSPNRITLSFYVKSNKTGTYIAELALPDASNNSNNQQSYTINSANTWERKTLSYVGNTTDAINNDNGIGMNVFFWLGAGSNFTSGTLTQNTWANTTAANRAVGQVNLADSTSNEWLITGVQMELGEQATPFEHRSFGDELARCQRYYQKSYNYSVAPGTNTQDGATYTVTQATASYPSAGHTHFKVEMRAAPTITSYDYGGTSGKMNAGGSAVTPVIQDPAQRGFGNYVSNTSVGVNSSVSIHYEANAEL
jgi:hypothetical protein